MKFFALAVLLITVMIPSLANAQVQEVIVTGYHFPQATIVAGLTPPPAANTQGSIGMSPEAFAAKTAAMAAAKKECAAAVKARYAENCFKTVGLIYKDNTNSCNTGTAVGTFAAGTSAALMGMVGLAAGVVGAPITMPMLIGGAVLTTIGIGGGYQATIGSISCNNAASVVQTDNQAICERNANKVALDVCQ